MTRADARRDDGFTLIETLVVIAIFGVVAAISMFGWKALAASMQQGGTQREIVSLLRSVQQRAVAEDQTYCVDFGSPSSTSWTVYRTPGADTGVLAAGFACSSGTQVGGPYKPQGGVTVSSVDFSQRNGSDTAFVLFYPRGAASGGSLVVGRNGSSKTNTVSVEGLTARVSSTGA